MDTVPLLAIAEQRYVDRLHCEFRQEINKLYREQDIQVDIAFRSQREDGIQSLVRDGMGVSMIPRYSLLRPELDYRRITDPALTRKVEFVVVDQTKVTPALQMLIEHARNHD